MVDSSSASSLSSVLSPHTAGRIDTNESGKTIDVKGEKLNNSAGLSTPKIDSSEGVETREEKAAVEDDKAVHKVSETTHNQPPGSRVDILA